jgi:hypothetical protein
MAKERVYAIVEYDHIKESFTTDERPLSFIRKMIGYGSGLRTRELESLAR